MKKVYIVALVTLSVTIGSLLAWMYLWTNIPKKSPLGAKQVWQHYEILTEPGNGGVVKAKV